MARYGENTGRPDESSVAQVEDTSQPRDAVDPFPNVEDRLDALEAGGGGGALAESGLVAYNAAPFLWDFSAQYQHVAWDTPSVAVGADVTINGSGNIEFATEGVYVVAVELQGSSSPPLRASLHFSLSSGQSLSLLDGGNDLFEIALDEVVLTTMFMLPAERFLAGATLTLGIGGGGAEDTISIPYLMVYVRRIG